MKFKVLTAFLFTLCFTLQLSTPAHAGRTPSEERASKLAISHFNKYGKKYDQTFFNQNTVESVEVKQMQELQRNLAVGALVLKTSAGDIPVVATFLKKTLLGWKISGWEVAGR